MKTCPRYKDNEDIIAELRRENAYWFQRAEELKRMVDSANANVPEGYRALYGSLPDRIEAMADGMRIFVDEIKEIRQIIKKLKTENKEILLGSDKSHRGFSGNG